MAVHVEVLGKLPDGTSFTVSGDTVTEVVEAYKTTHVGLTDKGTPTPTPDPPVGV